MILQIYLQCKKKKKNHVHSHELVVSDDLYCHLLATSGSVPGPDHVAEHSLTSVAIHIVALVQRLPDVHTYTPPTNENKLNQ